MCSIVLDKNLSLSWLTLSSPTSDLRLVGGGFCQIWHVGTGAWEPFGKLYSSCIDVIHIVRPRYPSNSWCYRLPASHASSQYTNMLCNLYHPQYHVNCLWNSQKIMSLVIIVNGRLPPAVTTNGFLPFTCGPLDWSVAVLFESWWGRSICSCGWGRWLSLARISSLLCMCI
jgi:hypothetical protein